MNNIREVKINHPELEGLRPVLETWTKLVVRYSDAFPKVNCCYWFNERANISVLAAAAWKAPGNWLALEEFSTRKHDDEGLRNGRCDLLITDIKNDNTFAVEAKHAWQNIRERCAGEYKKTKLKLHAAWGDASKLHKTEASVRVAACFVVPQIPVAEVEGNDLPGVVDEWLEGLAQKIKVDAFAWVFPKSSRNLVARNGRLYPGVCLLLRVRTRSKRKLKPVL